MFPSSKVVRRQPVIFFRVRIRMCCTDTRSSFTHPRTPTTTTTTILVLRHMTDVHDFQALTWNDGSECDLIFNADVHRVEILPAILLVRQDHNVSARLRLRHEEGWPARMGTSLRSTLALLDLRSINLIVRYLLYILAALPSLGDRGTPLSLHPQSPPIENRRRLHCYDAASGLARMAPQLRLAVERARLLLLLNDAGARKRSSILLRLPGHFLSALHRDDRAIVLCDSLLLCLETGLRPWLCNQTCCSNLSLASVIALSCLRFCSFGVTGLPCLCRLRSYAPQTTTHSRRCRLTCTISSVDLHRILRLHLPSSWTFWTGCTRKMCCAEWGSGREKQEIWTGEKCQPGQVARTNQTV